MKNQLFCILFFLLCAELGFGQTKEIDSLLNVVKKNDDTKKKADAFARLAWLNLLSDVTKASNFLDSSATIYNMLKDREGYIQIQYKRAVKNRLIGNYNEGLEQIDEFIEYYKAIGDSLSVADALFQKGVIVELAGDFSRGLKAYYRALSIYENNNQLQSIGNIHNSIGIIFKNFGQWDEAMKSYLKAEAIEINIDAKFDLSNTYNNMATIYALQKDFETAITYFKKCLKLSTGLNSKYGIALANQNIGITLFEQKKYNQALVHLKTAYKIQKKNNYKAELIETLSVLSLIYNDQGKQNLSRLYLKEGELLNTDFSIGEQIFHKAYYKFYESEKNFKESLHHYKQYSKLKDSIFNSENQLVINGLRIQYNTEKKDKELAEQKLELVDQQLAIQESNSKTRTMSILIISLLLGSILLWFSFRQRQKRMEQQLVAIEREQEVKTLESLMEGEEKERLRIAKELHDGVNGDLAAIKFKLTSLLETNNKVINEAVAMIDTSSEQVRAISHNLVPPSLRDFNLLEAVDTYCDNMNAIHAPEITFQHLGNEILLEKKQEANIFRIIQELVTNSIKHAEAKEIHVQLSNVEDNLQLTVEDDGKGFDVSNVKSDGIGMQNIKSRVEYLGALIDVKSDAKGTSFTITIVDNPQKA